jgi:hypothetical protein
MHAFLLAALLAFSPAQDGAADAYRRGDFETAQNLWIAALDGEGKSAAPISAQERGRILFDVGNAAFRRGNVLEAVGWYTASLRVRPRDADTWRNLEHARATAKLEPADRGDLASTSSRLLSSLTLAESEWLALAGAALWFAALVAEAVRGGRLFRRLAWVGLGVALVALSPWIYHCAHDGKDTVLVVEGADAASHGVEVHSEPRADATVIANANAGDEAERLDELPGWTKIELPGGSSGWIESRAAFPLRR